ncbi:recombinase family protein [Brevundimonas sp.]|uniref:recombinase family protein n=1 Tax=Brevundimonas sp. TaxID=1871086 RepID=UPI002D64EA83|nr:recombinase family protein [Brevundimonas sp.]HYD26357.1 recombinase family protein [Brevundimonas sp.]
MTIRVIAIPSTRSVYDDGGYSGGNIERPGLKRLLEDVDAGLVDTIVVYKIDRLSRSLADFARIVDRLDKAQASFVSVTQSFNTTTSMGRLAANTRARKERPLRSAQLPLKGAGVRRRRTPDEPVLRERLTRASYRYYVSAPLQQGRKVHEREGVLRRVSAEALEEAVRTQVATVLPGGSERPMAELLKPVRRVEVLPQELRIAFEAKALPRDVRERLQPCDAHPDQVVLVAPVRCQARGGRTWVLTPTCPTATRKARRDPVLIRGLRQAHRIAAGLGWRSSDGSFAGSGKAPTSSYERRLWPLVFLGPDIQQAILEGRQPPALTLDQLLKMRLPRGWPGQRRALGFDGK